MAFNENHATRCYDGQSLKERHPDLSQPFPKVRRGQRHKRDPIPFAPQPHAKACLTPCLVSRMPPPNA